MKNELVAASDNLERDTSLELGAQIGAWLTLSGLEEQMGLRRIEFAKRIKEGKLYEKLGLTWDQFCARYSLGARRTLDRQIEELTEMGGDYFGIRALTRIGKPAYALMDVKDGHIVHDGEKIAITKANEERIKEVVAHYRERATKAETEAAEQKRQAEKAREERRGAKEEVKRLQGIVRYGGHAETDAERQLFRALNLVTRGVALAQSARNIDDWDATNEEMLAAFSCQVFRLLAEFTCDPVQESIARYMPPQVDGLAGAPKAATKK